MGDDRLRRPFFMHSKRSTTQYEILERRGGGGPTLRSMVNRMGIRKGVRARDPEDRGDSVSSGCRVWIVCVSIPTGVGVMPKVVSSRPGLH